MSKTDLEDDFWKALSEYKRGDKQETPEGSKEIPGDP